MPRPTSGPAWRATSAPSASRKFAVDQLTDVIYIELPDVGEPTIAGDSFGEIESVKSVNDLYAPVDGEVIAVNDKLETDPSLVSKDPYGEGWLVKIKLEPGRHARPPDDGGAVREADRGRGALSGRSGRGDMNILHRPQAVRPEPAQQFVLHGVEWAGVRQVPGGDWRATTIRVTYDRGKLELMSPLAGP